MDDFLSLSSFRRPRKVGKWTFIICAVLAVILIIIMAVIAGIHAIKGNKKTKKDEIK